MQSIVFGLAWFLFNIVSAIVHAIFGAIQESAASSFSSGPLSPHRSHRFCRPLDHRHGESIHRRALDIPYVGPIARKQVGES